MSEHAQIRELLPLYVLGALEGTEECDRVCAHLATGCVECSAELADHARVAGRLPDALTPVAPRPELRTALEKTLAANAREPQATVVPIKAARARPSWPWIVIPTAAAAAAIFAAVNLNEQLRWEKNRHWEDAKEIANLRADLDRVRRALEEDEALAAALARGEAQVIELAPSKDQSGSGVVIWNKKERSWTLLASGMKPLTSDQVYELWFIKGSTDVRSAVRFQAGRDGFVRQKVSVPQDMPEIDVAAITVEPRANDAPGPTLPPIISGKIS